MIAKRWINITLIALLLFSAFGCARNNRKSDFELGQEYFQASDYEQAMVRLEKWVSKKKNPNIVDAYAMLAVIYHDRGNRQAEYADALSKLKEAGEPGMAAVLKLMENKTVGERLQNTINDIVVQGGSLSINPLLKDLRGANWRLKTNAQTVLVTMGEPVVDALIDTLNDQDQYTKSLAIEALTKIGDKRAIPALEKKLGDPSKFVQVTAATSLHSMGEKDYANIIADAMSDPSADARVAASRAAYEVLDNPPAAPLLKLIKDPDANVRSYSMLAVGKIRNAEAVPTLVKALKEDKEEQVRSSAAKALESIGSPSVEPLIAALKSTNDMEIIIRIAQVLGNIGDKKAVEPLESIYKKDSRSLVKNEVAKALNKID